MSDFLTIAPNGWVEVPEISSLINDCAVPIDVISSFIIQEQWGEIDTIMSSAVVLPDGKTVTKARVITTDTGYKFWVLYA